MTVLPLEFYQKDDVVQLSQDLLGKFLMTDFGNGLSGGMIIETEAYQGPEDRASHAYNNRRTKRNEVMYHYGGICYVYLCYGIHHLFNVVTNMPGIPHAILIRAMTASEGENIMAQRRKQQCRKQQCRERQRRNQKKQRILNGPGLLSQALGIQTTHNGMPLTRSPIWIEDRNIHIPRERISSGPRVGIDYAGDDASLPWRFQANLEE